VVRLVYSNLHMHTFI